MQAARTIGHGLATVVGRLLGVVFALLLLALCLALFIGFWFGVNWLLHAAGIPLRVLPRL